MRSPRPPNRLADNREVVFRVDHPAQRHRHRAANLCGTCAHATQPESVRVPIYKTNAVVRHGQSDAARYARQFDRPCARLHVPANVGERFLGCAQ
jgi:hypothetical protein